MIQELIDLRQSIIEGRTDDALEIIDDLVCIQILKKTKNLTLFANC